METRQIHTRDLSTVTGIQQLEHTVQSIYFLGLEDFEGDIYISIESDEYSNEAIPLMNNTFIIGQPMTLYNTTYICQIYGVLNNGEKIKLSKRFRLIVDKSNNIQGDSSQYPVDPNFENSIIEFMNEQKEQAQSEIEATGDAVIASIPSDYTALEQATYNAYPTESESGNPIYIDDGADSIPVKELIVNLEPKQSGSGDPSPSNVRPITGYDGVVIKRTGKNLIEDTPRDIGTFSGVTVSVNNKGQFILNGTATANNSARVGQCTLPSGDYELTGMTQTGSSSTFFINISPRFTGSNDQNLYSGYYRGTSETELTYTIRIYWRMGQTFNNMIFEPMIRLTSVTDSAFEPYQGQEYSITFPSSVGTVYGGTLNVTTGVLTVDRGFIASYNSETLPSTWISDRDVYTSGTTPTTGAQVVYKLATPTTVQLTPTEVSTLLGSNTIQSDGSMELEYRADTTKVIEKLTNAIVSLGGNV